MSTKKHNLSKSSQKLANLPVGKVRSRRTTIYDVIIRIVFIIYSVMVIYPLFWTVITSFKSNQEFYLSAWALPGKLRFENYVYAWNLANIGDYFMNSVIVVSASVVIALILSSTTAYVLAKYTFRGNGLIHKIYMSGLFVPLVLGLIPTFILLIDLSLYDKWSGLIIVYTVYSLPFSVFVLVGFFKTLPSELADAGRIDGCGDYGIFLRIMLPISKAGLVTVSIFNFLWTWNDYLFAMTIIPSERRRTLPVGLIRLTETMQFKTEWGPLFAGIVIVIVPTLLIYIFFQSQLTKGVTAGGIKG